MSNVDDAMLEWKKLEGEMEGLIELKKAGEFKQGSITKKLDEDDVTAIDARIAAIKTKLDGMITKTNTDCSVSVEKFSEIDAK